MFVEAKAAVAAKPKQCTHVGWVADLVMTLTGAHFNYACDTRSPGGCSRNKPMEPHKRASGNADWPPYAFTMIGMHRLLSVAQMSPAVSRSLACVSHPAVMRFWLDFKNDQKLPETLTQIDMHSAYFRKVKAAQIDLSLARPPQDVNRAQA